MSRSPTDAGALVRRTIDINYENKKRAHSLKWLGVNGVLVAVLLYDLWRWCPHTSALQYVEACAAALAAAAVVAHAWRLARLAGLTGGVPVLALTARQRRLLGLHHQQLDSSFNLVEEEPGGVGVGGGGRAVVSDSDSALSVSLSPRAWRVGGAVGAGVVAGGEGPSPAGGAGRARDHFISDAATLAAYLRDCDTDPTRLDFDLASADQQPPHSPYSPHPPPYQLAETTTETGQGQSQGQGPGQGEGKGEEARSPQLWRRLQLDPRRLTQWNLNLRLWIHVTILERVVRQMATVDAALAALGLAELRLGHASLDRLAKLAPAVPALAALLPFLELAPDQTYLVQRIRELARGGCLSEYRWCGGGATWEEAKPTDAEVVVHLFATYLDGQVPGRPGRAFTAAHVSSAPDAPRPPLGLHRARRRPPHYVLVLGEGDTLEVSSGRTNLLHTLLLFLAAAAREDPPALQRLHLGPAGLNMLWIIGR